MLRAGIITLFPPLFQVLSGYGVAGRAVTEGLLALHFWNPRDFAADRHKTVDDRPYGGGPGMVMKCAQLGQAIEAAREALPAAKVLHLSPQGSRLNQQSVAALAAEKQLILLCGRYEGIDERVVETHVDEEWSLGDFVLSGGEIAALALLDAVVRLQPGALGDEASALRDSFSDGLLDCPHYTRPENYRGLRVPQVLLSGNHGEIEKWRMKQSLGRTWLRRPDLLEKKELTEPQRQLLDEFRREHEHGEHGESAGYGNAAG